MKIRQTPAHRRLGAQRDTELQRRQAVVGPLGDMGGTAFQYSSCETLPKDSGGAVNVQTIRSTAARDHRGWRPLSMPYEITQLATTALAIGRTPQYSLPGTIGEPSICYLPRSSVVYSFGSRCQSPIEFVLLTHTSRGRQRWRLSHPSRTAKGGKG